MPNVLGGATRRIPTRAGLGCLAVAVGIAAAGCGSSNKSSSGSGASGGSATVSQTSSSAGSGSSSTSASSGATSSGGAKGKTIVLNGAGDINPWTKAYNHSIINALQAQGAKVTYLQDPYDESEHLAHLNTAVADSPDLILDVPQDAKSLVPALLRAKARKVPVIQLDQPPVSAENGLLVSTIEPNNHKLSKFAAEELVNGLVAQGRKTANIVVVTGGPSVLATERYDALKTAIKSHPGFKIAGTVENLAWDIATTQKVLPPLLAKLNAQGGVQAVLTMNDDSATGAYNAIKQTGGTVGGKNGVVLTSGNCTQAGVQRIEQGLEAGTATETPREEGKFVVKGIDQFFAGKKLSATVQNPHEAGITKANASKYMSACTY